MIARIWTARASPRDAHAYCDHFDRAVAPALRRLEGHAGAELLTLNRDDEVEILVITRWRSLEAIAGLVEVDAALVRPGPGTRPGG